MGESRRKKNLRDLRAFQADPLIEWGDRRFASKEDREIETYRAEIDQLTLNDAQPALEILADEVGPSLFPKDDKAVARFFIERATSMPPEVEVKVKLAALLMPYVAANEEVCSRAWAVVSASCQPLSEKAERVTAALAAVDALDDDDAKAVKKELRRGLSAEDRASARARSKKGPFTVRTGAEVLALVYADRLLRRELIERPSGRYIPFDDSDWRKHMTPAERAEFSKIARDELRQAIEKDLTGPAAEARHYLNVLSAEAHERLLTKVRDSRAYLTVREGLKVSFRKEYPDARTPPPEGLAASFTKLFDEASRDINRLAVLENAVSNAEELRAAAFLVAQAVFFDQADPMKPSGDSAPMAGMTDAHLTELGVSLWEKTYKNGVTDDEAERVIAGICGDIGITKRSSERIGLFAAKWAVHAFQRITTTHTYAAALMCSDADRSVLEDIEIQWHAFMVSVPNGLLTYVDSEGLEQEYGRIVVATFDGMSQIILLNQKSEQNDGDAVVLSDALTLADVLDVSQHAEGKDRVTRLVLLAKRLVAGLLLALQHQDNFKSKTYPAKESRRNREPHTEPAHRVVFVGAPLKVDCRLKVADYIQHGSRHGKHVPPQVQFIVRGHYRRQVIGVGRSGRKVIWIEPFWKGNEAAPILTRPKKIAPGTKEVT